MDLSNNVLEYTRETFLNIGIALKEVKNLKYLE